MTDSLQPALVLNEDVDAASEAVHFAGFPGLWVNGQPIAISELGFADVDAAAAVVEELGLPLEQTTVAQGDGLMPQVDGRLPGADEARASGWKPGPGDPGAELAPGEVFPPDPSRPDEEQQLVDAVVEQTADEAIAAVAAVDDLAELDALAQGEKAGKSRTTVLRAIDARRADLTPLPAVEA